MSGKPQTAPRPAIRPKGANILAVASGKGGVGKTWFAISLAHALARKGARTLLFDADIGLANVDIQLGLTPKNDLGGVLSGRLTLNQATISSPETEFDLIAGRSGLGSLANLPPSRIQMLSDDLTLMAATYDRVILDLGAGVERTVRQFAQNVGTCLVITTDEPTALTDAYAFIKILHAERAETDIRVVINMANSTHEGERTYNTLHKACEGFLKFSPPLLGVIRRDNRVREAIRHQTSIMTRFPNTEAVADIEAIAERLSR